ncbi:MAG: GntR family transcriptional regulator [bacterium]|nr:GntR family transcriptional regulator [bacterium]
MKKQLRETIYYATQIREDIRTKILSGVFQQGEKLPPEEEIAESYGVSRMTARQALVELVVEGLIHRIPGRGTFVSDNISFQGNKITGRNIVAIIVPNLRNSFYSQLVSSAQKMLKRFNVHMVLDCVEDDAMEEKKALEDLNKNPYTGLLLVAGYYSEENILLVKEVSEKIPVVIMDVKLEGIKSDLVISDDKGGGFLATEHLIELGYKNILHLAGPEGDSSADNRRKGYEEALRRYNIEHRNEYIRFTDWSMKEGYYQTKKFLMNNGETLTAIFACNDEVAIGAYNAVREEGKNIPEDIAIMGYGNSDIGGLLEVPLSTVDQAVDEMGEIGAKLLVEKITGKRKREDKREIVIPTKLIVRESCGIVKRKVGI